MTDDVRDRIERAFRDVHPPQDSRAIVGMKAWRIERRHRFERGLIALVVIAGVVVPLMALRELGSDGEERSAVTAATELSSDGVSVDVPAGWNGRFMPVDGFPQEVLVVASVPLPDGLDEDASELRAQLRSGNEGLLWLVEYAALCPPCEDFKSVGSLDDLTVESGDLSGYPERRFPLAVESIEGHAASSQLFELRGRFFDLRVEFGSTVPDGSRLAQVNAMITSISVEAPPEGSRIWSCIEPTLLDPDCPDHRWLVDVLKQAGFSMAGDTGGALLAKKGSLEVTAWISVSGGLPVGEPNETIAGTIVTRYSQDHVYWTAPSGRQVWIGINTRHGRLDHPTLVQLVEASQKSE